MDRRKKFTWVATVDEHGRRWRKRVDEIIWLGYSQGRPLWGIRSEVGVHVATIRPGRGQFDELVRYA